MQISEVKYLVYFYFLLLTEYFCQEKALPDFIVK